MRALEIMRREENIDLLITDQAMPGMTGSELVSKVRAEKPGFPVILATGYAELPPGRSRGNSENCKALQTARPRRSDRRGLCD